MSDDRRTKCANCGRNNGRAITVKATDIEGNEYTVNGTMRQFTSEHNLCYDTARKQYTNGYKPKRGPNKNWTFTLIS